jgi:hypothetical protein
MHVPQARDHKFAGPIDYLSGARYGDPVRLTDSNNVVSANEEGHVLLWLANSWIDDGDMGERKVAGLRVNHPRKPQQCAEQEQRAQNRLETMESNIGIGH